MTVAVDCPTCGRRVEWTPASRWRPFCSERCKLVDLGAWASGQYTVPGEAPSDDVPGMDDAAGSRSAPPES